MATTNNMAQPTQIKFSSLCLANSINLFMVFCFMIFSVENHRLYNRVVAVITN